MVSLRTNSFDSHAPGCRRKRYIINTGSPPRNQTTQTNLIWLRRLISVVDAAQARCAHRCNRQQMLGRRATTKQCLEKESAKRKTEDRKDGRGRECVPRRLVLGHHQSICTDYIAHCRREHLRSGLASLVESEASKCCSRIACVDVSHGNCQGRHTQSNLGRRVEGRRGWGDDDDARVGDGDGAHVGLGAEEPRD